MIHSRPRRSFRAGLAALGFLAAWAGQARGQDAPDPHEVKAYQAHVATALEHWQAEKYADARAEYQMAYNIQPQPILLFNIASTYRKEDNFEKAMSYYRQYLEVAPADSEHRAQAEWAIDVLEDIVTEQEKSGAGATAPAPVSRAPAAGGVPMARDDSSRAYLYAGVVTGGAGAIALGYGLFEGKRAADRESFFEKLPDGYAWTEEDQKKYNQGQRFERRAVIFSILGGAALVTGVALALVGPRDDGEDREEALGVAPMLGDSGAGLSLLGSF